MNAPDPMSGPPVPNALLAAVSAADAWLLALLLHSDEPADEIARQLLTHVDPVGPD